jgi:hypothetical protein
MYFIQTTRLRLIASCRSEKIERRQTLALRFTPHSQPSVGYLFIYFHFPSLFIFYFYFSILMEIATVIRTVCNAAFGETLRSYFWTLTFGHRWLAILIDIRMGCKIKTISWNAILQSFPCFRGKEVDLSEEGLADHFLISENHWRLGIIEKPALFLEGKT